MSNHNSAVLIGLDWGTTNVRAALLDAQGKVLDKRCGESGVGKLDRAGFEKRFDELVDEWPDLPALAAGMVGSRQGWQEAAYLNCPTSPAMLADALTIIQHQNHKIGIIPGLKRDDAERADVMRGEETQLAGHLAAHPDFSGTLIMPGTHSKWVKIQGGEIVDFTTYMTGDLFHALSQHTLLRHSVDGKLDKAVFKDCCTEIARNQDNRSAEAQLFALRARDLLTGENPSVLHTRLSALLIMAEMAAGQKDGYKLAQTTILIGSGPLTELYKRALASYDISGAIIDGTDLVWPALLAIADNRGWQKS